jgi:hypothetical protein
MLELLRCLDITVHLSVRERHGERQNNETSRPRMHIGRGN